MEPRQPPEGGAEVRGEDGSGGLSASAAAAAAADQPPANAEAGTPAVSGEGEGSDRRREGEGEGQEAPEEMPSTGFTQRLITRPTQSLRLAYESRDLAAGRLDSVQSDVAELRAALSAAEEREVAASRCLRTATRAVFELELAEPDCVWNEMYGRLVEFQRLHGHTRVPVPRASSTKKKASDGKKAAAAADEATAEEEVDAETAAADPDDEGASSDDDSSAATVDAETIAFRKWVASQRSKYKRGTLQRFPHRVHALRSIPGFAFAEGAGSASVGRFWTAKYELLKRWKAKHGHCLVPFKCGDEFPGLGKWVVAQRDNATLFRKKQSGAEVRYSSMNEERMKLLQEIGFAFDKNIGALRWGKKYDRLKEFYEREGHVYVEKNEDRELFDFVKETRILHGHSKLTDEQIELLNAIQFPWEEDGRLEDIQWERGIALLQKFRTTFPNIEVPLQKECTGDMEEWKGLSQWVARQWHQHGKGMLREKPDRIAALRRLGVELTQTHDERWEAKYAELVDFQRRHGHASVPGHWAENPSLAKWVVNQRVRKRKADQGERGAFPAERLKLLEKVGFDFEPSKGPHTPNRRTPNTPNSLTPNPTAVAWTERLAAEVKWNERLSEMAAFHRIHGHCRIPNDDVHLALWASEQRTEFSKLLAGRSSTMTTHRMQALNALSFDWLNLRARSSVLGPSGAQTTCAPVASGSDAKEDNSMESRSAEDKGGDDQEGQDIPDTPPKNSSNNEPTEGNTGDVESQSVSAKDSSRDTPALDSPSMATSGDKAVESKDGEEDTPSAKRRGSIDTEETASAQANAGESSQKTDRAAEPKDDDREEVSSAKRRHSAAAEETACAQTSAGESLHKRSRHISDSPEQLEERNESSSHGDMLL